VSAPFFKRRKNAIRPMLFVLYQRGRMRENMPKVVPVLHITFMYLLHFTKKYNNSIMKISPILEAKEQNTSNYGVACVRYGILFCFW
jgi:hypothetical protein